MRITDAEKRIVEIYNRALKECGVQGLEFDFSRDHDAVRFAIFESLKDGQTRRKKVAASIDAQSLIHEVGRKYGFSAGAVQARANELWNQIRYGNY